MAIGLYIHIPFCLKKCRYCDFISFPVNKKEVEAYLEALSREIRLYGSTLSGGEKDVSSLFIGGGTPTCLPGPGLKVLVEDVRSAFSTLPGCEITVEANPGTLDRAGLQHLSEAGVNRISMGVQSFQDRLLGVLGRIHTAQEAVAGVKQIREAGFQNLNLDLIYGIPGQTAEDWQGTLQEAVNLSPEHIAAYGLQLEEGTLLELAVARGDINACPEDLELHMYRTAIDFLSACGYHHYEISNFARPGRQSAHNRVYWLNRPYLGLGVGAHSYFQGERFANVPSLERYIERLSREQFPVEAGERLSMQTEMSETMFLGLRLLEGVDLHAFYRRFGRRAEEVYRNEIARLLEDGLLEQAGGRLRLAAKGLPLANRVFREFV